MTVEEVMRASLSTSVGTAQLEKWIRAGDLRKEEKEQ